VAVTEARQVSDGRILLHVFPILDDTVSRTLGRQYSSYPAGGSHILARVSCRPCLGRLAGIANLQ